jgi:hypothetical protein
MATGLIQIRVSDPTLETIKYKGQTIIQMSQLQEIQAVHGDAVQAAEAGEPGLHQAQVVTVVAEVEAVAEVLAAVDEAAGVAADDASINQLKINFL